MLALVSLSPCSVKFLRCYFFSLLYVLTVPHNGLFPRVCEFACFIFSRGFLWVFFSSVFVSFNLREFLVPCVVKMLLQGSFIFTSARSQGFHCSVAVIGFFKLFFCLFCNLSLNCSLLCMPIITVINYNILFIHGCKECISKRFV